MMFRWRKQCKISNVCSKRHTLDSSIPPLFAFFVFAFTSRVFIANSSSRETLTISYLRTTPDPFIVLNLVYRLLLKKFKVSGQCWCDHGQFFQLIIQFFESIFERLFQKKCMNIKILSISKKKLNKTLFLFKMKKKIHF